MDYKTALDLGLIYFNERIAEVPELTNPFVKDTSLGRALIEAMRDMRQDELETLELAKNGDTKRLASELQGQGKGMVRDGLKGLSTPDKIKETTLGVRVYEIGMMLSQKPQNPTGSQSSS